MDMKLFALNSAKEWGEKIAAHLGIELASHEETDFEDGEHKIRSLDNVRGQQVFILQTLISDGKLTVNDKLCRLLFFIASLRDASAAKITVLLPYFAYARKDRRTKARDPVTMRYMAQLFEAVGTDRIVSMDVHNLAAFQNAFRVPTENLEARVIFASYLAKRLNNEDLVVVSPDAGGTKRAEQLQETLSQLLQREVTKAFLDKKRSSGLVETSEYIVGEVKNRVAIIIDDIISSGTTMRLAVEALHKQGAKTILACATHGLFVGHANQLLATDYLEKIIITDALPPFRLHESLLTKVELLDATMLFAEAIKRIYENGSVVELMERYPFDFAS
ncbi:ribose-phosphate pyrophosphokinase [Legionella jordanis]|nr:ribose-phosphate pyrophosphokinase [Legionella jordanis]